MKSDDDHDYDDDNHIDDNDDYNNYQNDDNHETKTKSMITTTTMSRMGLMKTIKIGERSFSKATSITNVGQVWAPNSQLPEGKTGWIRPDIRSERRSILVFLSIFLQGTWTSGILKMLRWANSSVVNLWWKSKILIGWKWWKRDTIVKSNFTLCWIHLKYFERGLHFFSTFSTPSWECPLVPPHMLLIKTSQMRSCRWLLFYNYPNLLGTLQWRR